MARYPVTVTATIYREQPDGSEVAVPVSATYTGPTHGLVEICDAVTYDDLTGEDLERAEQALLRAMEGRA